MHIHIAYRIWISWNMYRSLIETLTNCFGIRVLDQITVVSLVVILCSWYLRDFVQCAKCCSIFSVRERETETRTFVVLRLRDEIIRTTRFVSRKRARLIQCEFHIREQVSKGEEGRKNVRGTAGTLAKGLSPHPPVSLFLPSFLPSFRGAIWDHAVYISSGYYMHILLSCIRFLHLTPRISRTSPPASTSPISRAYAILHGAHASLTSPRAPTIPLARHHFLRPLPLLLLLPFLPVWNPNSWRLVAEGTVPRLSHREIHSRAQLMPSESKSYFVHWHFNFQHGSFTISLLLSVFL